MSVGENIKKIRKEKGLTQKKLGELCEPCISESTIRKYELGILNPKIETIDKIAAALDVPILTLMGHEVIDPSALKGVKIPVLGRVAAGTPVEACEDIIGFEEIPEDMARTGTFFALRINGDSMSPKISDGNTVIVRQQDTADTGDIVVAFVNGDDATCKRLRKYKDGIELIPDNPSYAPMFFSNEDIQSKPVRIIGKVVELRVKF